MVSMRWSAVEYFCGWASDSDDLPESCSDRRRFLQPEPRRSDTGLLGPGSLWAGRQGGQDQDQDQGGGKKSKSVEKNQTERFFASRKVDSAFENNSRLAMLRHRLSCSVQYGRCEMHLGRVRSMLSTSASCILLAFHRFRRFKQVKLQVA